MASSTPKIIAVINGPNMNWLGRREPEIYGATTLQELDDSLIAQGKERGVTVECHQHNGEGELVDLVYALTERGVRHMIINAGAYTHTSVALRDALSSVGAQFVEVHISNVYQRESFRHHSYLSPIAAGVIVGCGVKGYGLALQWLIDHES